MKKIYCFLPILAVIFVCHPSAVHADCAVSISDAPAINEGSGGANIVTFTVTKTGTSGCSVLFSTSDETATAGNNTCAGNADYMSLINGGISLLAGETSRQISITTCGDSMNEGDETFVINLHDPGTGTTIARGQGRATLLNDDPVPSLNISDTTRAEGNAGVANATFNVTLSSASGFSVTTDFATTATTATAGAACGGNTDFVTTTGTVTFTPGQTSRQINVPICGDTAIEPNETFRVNLSNATHATIADGVGQGTITNDDAQPSLTINDVTVTEGNTGQLNATFTVSMAPAGSNAVSVNFATANVSATGGAQCVAGGNVDYVTTTGTLTFPAGTVTPQHITVPVCGDLTVEPNETFRVNLTNATNATIGDGQGQGTITNNDLPSLTINGLQKNEGLLGPQTASLTITLSAANPSGATVVCTPHEIKSTSRLIGAATGGTSCTSGIDFILKRGTTITFGPTDTSKTCTVTICGDALRETDEGFGVDLSSPQGATIATGTAGVLIKNDD